MSGREEVLCVEEDCHWKGFEDELDFSDEDYLEGLCPKCGSCEWLYTP